MHHCSNIAVDAGVFQLLEPGRDQVGIVVAGGCVVLPLVIAQERIEFSSACFPVGKGQSLLAAVRDQYKKTRSDRGKWACTFPSRRDKISRRSSSFWTLRRSASVKPSPNEKSSLPAPPMARESAPKTILTDDGCAGDRPPFDFLLAGETGGFTRIVGTLDSRRSFILVGLEDAGTKAAAQVRMTSGQDRAVNPLSGADMASRTMRSSF